MRPHPLRHVRLLCLALLLTLLPGAGIDAVRARDTSVSAVRFRPLVLPWRPSAAGLTALPLGWLTYLGGSKTDEATAMATDGQGNVYVTGDTNSSDFPVTANAAQPALALVQNAFVASYAAGGRLRWATYLGGSGILDEGRGIATDGESNVYVVGETDSTDFPVTPGAAQPQLGGPGAQNAFVASYDMNGRLRWATYLGGSSNDEATGVVVDTQGNVYVTGNLQSSDFPISLGSARPVSGGNGHVFIASYDRSGHIRWTTSLGGSDLDVAEGITADRQGNIYITGSTGSNDFPITPGAAQTHPGGSNGGGNAFVASYNGSGHLRWATYLSGTTGADGTAIAADDHGHVYVAGSTYSSDFPVTAGAAQPQFGGGASTGSTGSTDAFVASYDASGHVRWATYLGGAKDDAATGIGVDRQGNVYVTGQTHSTDFPVTPGSAQPRNGDEHTFAASYDGSGRLRWATYLGDTNGGSAAGFATDRQGNIYIAGSDYSGDLPVTPGAAQTIFGGRDSSGGDAFVARMLVPSSRPAALDPASSPPTGTPNARYFPSTGHTLAGPYLAAWTRLGGIPTLGLPLSEPFTLAGQQVQVTERAVLVLTGEQVNLLPLGRLLSAARVFAPVAPPSGATAHLYFPSTGHTLSGPFLAYWQAHQGSVLLGPPIAEPDREGLGDGTGRVYQVQWFVNGRLELHPEVKNARFQVLQGRVGYEFLHRAGLL